MLIAQISDMHVAAPGEPGFAGVDAAARLARCVAQLVALAPRPDVVLATGDLAAGGRDESYAALRVLLAPLAMPVYVVPGNDDDRDGLRRAFPDHHYLPRAGAFLHYAVEDHPLRLVGLDTLEPGEIGGRLCPQRLAWVRACLAEQPDRPTVLFMHHPPFDTGMAAIDARPLEGRAELAAIVGRHPRIERVLCGHVHRPVQVRWQGTLATTCPSTAMAAELTLDPAADLAWSAEPPAWQLHLWRPDSGLVSHLSLVGSFDQGLGPVPD